ncbi:tagaturonate reductase [Pseudozobellia thermophila]|uniref:Tagaturonate reductase n=1 Tax=Pseudozobellia thermophila TaxID=192903 RepID=A0A1M6GK67_9FLAO|nr:tagaturonate reductase [Pseudozobellia thermophila]SHJ10310.1 tagaturonate reductase [Pseudozobellia thermophila]
MEYLNRSAIGHIEPRPVKILQFGGGNFLRAFVDQIVQDVNEKTDFNAGVALVKPTERGDYKELKSQDGLFSVELEGMQKGRFLRKLQIIDCVQQVINPYTEWNAYINLAKNPDLRFIISNTTEAGIQFNPGDRAEDRPPKEFPAKLALWLLERYRHFKGAHDKGCILLPCELIEDNGTALKRTVLQYADHWGTPDGFKTWIDQSNTFCNTLVDRIVSGFPKHKIDTIEQELGYKDQLAVSGELYLNWLIEGPESILGEFPFNQTDLNIDLVNQLAPYRNLKVRVLNGAHTAMVPIGYLLGHRLVKEVMADKETEAFVSNLLQNEVVPTLDLPHAYIDTFVADVLDRFKNPSLDHKLLSIALNSTSKFRTRLLPTLKDNLASSEGMPQHIILAFAALLRMYEGVDLQGKKIDLNDDPCVLAFFKEKWDHYRKNGDILELTQSLLGNTDIWQENLNRIPYLTQSTASFLESIETTGLSALVRNVSADIQNVKPNSL